jgi:hypothetical protein
VYSLFLCGCNYLRTFPLYSKVYIEHPEKIQIFDESKWVNNPYYEGSDRHKRVSQLKTAVEFYINSHPNTKPEISNAMRNLIIVKGMNKSEALIIAGSPTKKILKNGKEIWLYKKWPDLFSWYYKWGKLKFKDDILFDIEQHCIDIYK